MSDARSDLIHRSLDGELSEDERAELRAALSADPDLAQELASLELLQGDLQSLNVEPEVGLTDKIMRSLPERPGPVPFYKWILRPVRLPAWAMGALAVLLMAGTFYLGRLGAPVPAVDPTPVAVKAPAPAQESRPVATTVATTVAACPTPQVMVRFLIKAPGAKQVSLAGDFNEWSVEQTLMSDDDDNGVWTVTVPLQPGRYQYKFLVDGEKWLVEPDAPAYQSDGFGGKNSLLVI